MSVEWYALVDTSAGVQFRDQGADAVLCLELGHATDLQGCSITGPLRLPRTA